MDEQTIQDLYARRFSRRNLIKTGALAGATLGAGSLLAACGGSDEDATATTGATTGGGGGATATTGGQTPATSASPTTGETGGATGSPTAGGPIKNGTWSDAEPKSGGSLSMSLSDADPKSFDPIVPTDNMSIWTMLLIYDQVIRVGPDGLSLEPGLAEKWEASADGMTYTFNLRDAVFHDGSTVTADDCKYCLDRVISGENSQWAWIFTQVNQYQVTDDKTLVGTLKGSWAPYLADLGLYGASIFPSAAHKEKGDDLFNSPIGSGPFKWVSWEHDVSVKLTKNPDYWIEGQPYLDDLEFKVLTDANQRMLQFQSGELDIATDVPFSQLDALKTNPDVVVATDAVARLDYIAINNRRFPDKKARQAINYAVDKDSIIKNVLFGAGEMATNCLPKMLYWSPNVPGYPYDLDKAKELIAASAMKDGFKAQIVVSNGDPVGQQVCQVVADNLKEIGGDVTLLQTEPGSYTDKIHAFEYDMSKSYYTTDIIDPDELISFSVLQSGGASSVWTDYSNPQVEQLGTDAAKETDPDKRAALYEQIETISSDDAPVIYLYYPTGRTAIHKGIHNFSILPTGNYRLWETWRES